MQINLLQMKIESSIKKNIDKVIRLTEDLSESLIILPELFTTGFNYELIYKQDESHINILNHLPATNTYIGSIIRKNDGGYYNSFFIHKNGKTRFIYDKVHLFPVMEEDRHLCFGNNPGIFTIDGLTCGAGICFDIRFPELFRNYFRKSAEIIFLPAEWPEERISQLIRMCRSRAIENQCFFVLCNASGKTGKFKFGGMSSIFTPYGDNLNTMHKKCDTLIHENIDLSLVENVRVSIPVKNLLREDIYGK